MTEAQFKEQLHVAQDMLEAISQQRDGANNQVVQLAAQLKAAQRKIQELEALAAKDADAAPELDLGHSKANGHLPAAMN